MTRTIAQVRRSFFAPLAALPLVFYVLGCGSSINLIPASAMPAASLRFITEPTTVSAESPFSLPIKIELLNADGTLASSDVTIKLRVLGTQTLYGATVVKSHDGIATFPAIAVRSPSQTLQLRADAAGFLSATSDAFEVVAPKGATSILADPTVRFLDSIGVNAFLHYQDTPYGAFQQVKKALTMLGIHHVRDGLIDTTWQPYYDEHNELGRLGIKSTYVSSNGQSSALLSDYPRRMKDSIEAFEAPNEDDAADDPSWKDHLLSELTALNSARAKGTVSLPLYGPSLTRLDSYYSFGDQHTAFDFGNMHDYLAGRNPGTVGWGQANPRQHRYGSIEFNLDEVALSSPELPVVTTETGYNNDVNQAGSFLPEAVSGIYMPRLILEQWRAGIQRTYIYQLVSDHLDDFGLFRSDWSPKPAALALAALTSVLKDEGSEDSPETLTVDLTGGGEDLHHLLLHKTDGSFYLALWKEEPAYDPNDRVSVEVFPDIVTVRLSTPAHFEVHSWSSSGQVTTGPDILSDSLPIGVADRLVVLRIVQSK